MKEYIGKEGRLKTFTYRLLGWLVLAVLFSLGVRYFFPKDNIIIKHTVTTKYEVRDSLIYRDSLIPVKVKVPVTEWDTVYIPADTAELIAKYKTLWLSHYTKKVFKDSLIIDSLGNIKVRVNISANNIDTLVWETHLRIPHTYSEIVTVPKHVFYVGAAIGKDNFSPMLLYTRNHSINYFVNYNVIQGEVTGGVLINIDKIKSW